MLVRRMNPNCGNQEGSGRRESWSLLQSLRRPRMGKLETRKRRKRNGPKAKSRRPIMAVAVMMEVWTKKYSLPHRNLPEAQRLEKNLPFKLPCRNLEDRILLKSRISTEPLWPELGYMPPNEIQQCPHLLTHNNIKQQQLATEH